MKKTLLSVALLSSITAAQAQREVSSAQRIDFELPAERGTDTLFMSSLGTGLQILGAQGGGFVSGSNGYGDYAKAQEFMLSGPVTVDEVLFLFAKEVTTGGAGSSIRAVIWDMDGTVGTTSAGTGDQPSPNTELGTSGMISIDDIDTTGIMAISVGGVMTDGHFAAGIDVTALATGDHVGIATTTNGNVGAPDRSWEQWNDDTWNSLNSAWNNMNVDLFVAPVVTADWVSVGEGTWVNNMRMSIIGGNPATDNVTIRYENQNDAAMNIRIFDSAGRTVVQQDLGNRAAGLHNYDVNTSAWNAGVYYVTLSANGQPMTLKLVKK